MCCQRCLHCGSNQGWHLGRTNTILVLWIAASRHTGGQREIIVRDIFWLENFDNKVMNAKQFSIIHINCRSLGENFLKIKYLLESLHHSFDVICIE